MHNTQWSKKLLTKAVSPTYVNFFWQIPKEVSVNSCQNEICHKQEFIFLNNVTEMKYRTSSG